jgi:hypothetical protein
MFLYYLEFLPVKMMDPNSCYSADDNPAVVLTEEVGVAAPS